MDELIQVLVAGMATTGISLAALVLWPWGRAEWLMDPHRWLSDGDEYFKRNLSAIVLTSGLILLLAIAIAHLAARWVPQATPQLNDRSSMWVHALAAEDARLKYVSAELLDGRVFEGYLEGFTPDGAVDEQVMALGPPLFVKRSPFKQAERYEVDRLALPLSQVKYAAVVLRDPE